jgi:hypothetical protein
MKGDLVVKVSVHKDGEILHSNAQIVRRRDLPGNQIPPVVVLDSWDRITRQLVSEASETLGFALGPQARREIALQEEARRRAT